MDHKVSKDMISSGMIPSGEKTQADLSRTQYGSAPSPSKLMDAYKSMYEHHKKDADGNTIPHDGEELNEAGPLAALAPLLTKVGAAAKTGAAAAKSGAIRTGIKLGGKTGGKFVKGAIDKPLTTAANVNYASNMIPQSTSSSKDGKNKTVELTAGADLFDIVKGKLLDEGMSEEEIRDIMLTLTPDEILNELSGDLLRKATVAAGDKAAKLASQKDTAGAVNKLEQQKRLSSAMKSKNLEKSRAENMRKPTQYDRPLSRPTPDPTKPYPGTPR